LRGFVIQPQPPASFNTEFEIALYHPSDLVNGPVKNRLHDYEAGWLTLLVEMGVATEKQAHDAMGRVAQAAIDDRSVKFMSKPAHARLGLWVPGRLGV
jgi:hypothetical protein